MSIFRRILYLLLVLAPLPVVFFWGGVPIHEQLGVIDLLITVSSIVFGVMGIWISILYPDAIRDKHLRDEYKVKAVFSPLVKATIMLVICVIYKVSYPILSQFALPELYRTATRKLSYFVIIEVSIQMLISIVSVLIPANFLKSDIDTKKALDAQRDRLFRRGSKGE